MNRKNDHAEGFFSHAGILCGTILILLIFGWAILWSPPSTQAETKEITILHTCAVTAHLFPCPT
jgi:hypothetical protein